jgi:hypothetical protein
VARGVRRSGEASAQAERRAAGRPRPNQSLDFLGPLDPLCELEPGQGHEELLPQTEVTRDEGIEIRVVDLPTLIEIKSRVGRAKDKLVVAELIAILEERQQRE